MMDLSKLTKLIVNADDFGYSEAVNLAILTGFESSLLTSTSMMANMPGFDHGVDLVRRHPVLQHRVGLHLNLTEGSPLSGGMVDCEKWCASDGRFIYDRGMSLFRLSRGERSAIYGELRMQLERLLGAGIRPVHLDSHHHTHTEWAIAPLVCRLAKEYDIKRIRLTRNMGLVPSRAKRYYKKLFNSWFLGRRSGLVENTDFFGDIGDMNYFVKHKDTKSLEGLSFEIMVHPLFDPGGRLVDYDGKDLREGLDGLRRLEGLEGLSTYIPIDL